MCCAKTQDYITIFFIQYGRKMKPSCLKFGFIIFSILFFLSCQNNSENGFNEPLTNVFKLEIRFGDDNSKLPIDYTLANPKGIAVNKNNDILVVDENYIKIYKKSGNPLKKIGGTGQGPGEFSRAQGIRIGFNNKIIVKHSIGHSYFSKDFEFLNIRYFGEKLPVDSFLMNYKLSGKRLLNNVTFSAKKKCI
jgi:hypothetical protein